MEYPFSFYKRAIKYEERALTYALKIFVTLLKRYDVKYFIGF